VLLDIHWWFGYRWGINRAGHPFRTGTGAYLAETPKAVTNIYT